MTRLRTLATLVLLQAALPLNLAVSAVAALSGFVDRPRRVTAAAPKTVLISGGKMTKALQLARSFSRAGHRVVLVETAKYRFTGHRFSNAVDRFYTVPAPQSPDYSAALLDIVRREGVDVYIPVCSPAASYYDALAKPVLEAYCDVVQCDPDVLKLVDDKDSFARTAAALGLVVPDTVRVTAPEQIVDFDFARTGRPYVLKSIAYDPIARLDLTLLPLDTPEQTEAFARSKPISEQSPWILQEFVEGQEYCTHSTVRDGELRLHCCCESSAFQLNYTNVDKPEIREWVTTFVKALGITGQVSLDFIQSTDGRLAAIECNPRTHSAITMFYNHPGVAAAYLQEDAAVPAVEPLPTSRPTYWVYHEVWRLITGQGNRWDRLRTIVRGKDAIFDRTDPLPFLLEHHLQMPWLLLRSLWHGTHWTRIDFNIGKLVEPAGD